MHQPESWFVQIEHVKARDPLGTWITTLHIGQQTYLNQGNGGLSNLCVISWKVMKVDLAQKRATVLGMMIWF